MVQFTNKFILYKKIQMTDNQKIGVGILALVAVYFVAMKVMANAAKDKPKVDDTTTKEGFDKTIDVSKIKTVVTEIQCDQAPCPSETTYNLNGNGYLMKYFEPIVNKEVYSFLSNQKGDNIPFYDAVTGKILGYNFNDANTGDVKTILY